MPSPYRSAPDNGAVMDDLNSLGKHSGAAAIFFQKAQEAESDTVQRAYLEEVAKNLGQLKAAVEEASETTARLMIHDPEVSERRLAHLLRVSTTTIRKWTHRTTTVRAEPGDPDAFGSIIPRKRVTHDD